MDPLELRGQRCHSGTSKECFTALKIKTMHEINSGNSTFSIHVKIYLLSFVKVLFTTSKSHSH